MRRLVGELEARGYLHFVLDVDDLRVQRLRLTDKAKDLDSSTSRRRLAQTVGRAFEHIEDGEIELWVRRMELWARGLAAGQRRRDKREACP